MNARAVRWLDRTPPEIVSLAMKMRTEGMGIRAGRVWKSHATIICWDLAISQQKTGPPALQRRYYS